MPKKPRESVSALRSPSTTTMVASEIPPPVLASTTRPTRDPASCPPTPCARESNATRTHETMERDPTFTSFFPFEDEAGAAPNRGYAEPASLCHGRPRETQVDLPSMLPSMKHEGRRRSAAPIVVVNTSVRGFRPTSRYSGSCRPPSWRWASSNPECSNASPLACSRPPAPADVARRACCCRSIS